MITIITGKVDSGKTTKLLSIHEGLQNGEGFIIKKVFCNGVHIGQEVIRLSTGESKPFSFKKSHLPQYWDESCCYGQFSFSGQGLSFARKIILDSLRIGTEPLFIDEIGPLELQGKGFSDILALALSSRRTLYLTVREACLDAVTAKFSINSCTTIHL